jgi:hypothetical protein
MATAKSVTISNEQFAQLLAAATANSSAEEAAVATKKEAVKAPVQRLAIKFEKLEGEDAEKYGDVSIAKLLPNGGIRKRMAITLDEAISFADFVMENFAERLEA